MVRERSTRCMLTDSVSCGKERGDVITSLGVPDLEILWPGQRRGAGDRDVIAPAVGTDLAERTRATYRAGVLHEQSREVGWARVPSRTRAETGRIDPRTFTVELDRALPAEWVAAATRQLHGLTGKFICTPDDRGFCFMETLHSCR
jgi:hypothetical protein